MNLDLVKNDIKEKLYAKVELKIYGTRNKIDTLVGFISNVYPNIFTICVDNEQKSFRYADIITGDIKIKYL